MTDDSDGSRELVLERIIKAPRQNIWRCWTEGELLMRWYCPLPWKVTEAELDVRPGGRFYVMMQGPGGEQAPAPGVYLAVDQGRRLVFTDAFEKAWAPSGKAFMVGDITLEDTPEGYTRYTARSLHWTVADREEHERMGFHEGWGIAADQLERLAQSI